MWNDEGIFEEDTASFQMSAVINQKKLSRNFKVIRKAKYKRDFKIPSSVVPGLANTTSVSLATLASRKPKINFTGAKHQILNSGNTET